MYLGSINVKNMYLCLNNIKYGKGFANMIKSKHTCELAF